MYRKSIYAWKQSFDIVYFIKSNFDIGFHVLQRLLKEIIRRSDTHNYWIISCEELNISCSLTLENSFVYLFVLGMISEFVFDIIQLDNQTMFFVWIGFEFDGWKFKSGLVQTQNENWNHFLYYVISFLYLFAQII